MLRFEWDEAKSSRNRSKHKVWFEEAQGVFDDPAARVFYDDSHSEKEDRFVIIGMSFTGRLLVVVHCHTTMDLVRKGGERL